MAAPPPGRKLTRILLVRDTTSSLAAAGLPAWERGAGGARQPFLGVVEPAGGSEELGVRQPVHAAV